MDKGDPLQAGYAWAFAWQRVYLPLVIHSNWTSPKEVQKVEVAT